MFSRSSVNVCGPDAAELDHGSMTGSPPPRGETRTPWPQEWVEGTVLVLGRAERNSTSRTQAREPGEWGRLGGPRGLGLLRPRASAASPGEQVTPQRGRRHHEMPSLDVELCLGPAWRNSIRAQSRHGRLREALGPWTIGRTPCRGGQVLPRPGNSRCQTRASSVSLWVGGRWGHPSTPGKAGGTSYPSPTDTSPWEKWGPAEPAELPCPPGPAKPLPGGPPQGPRRRGRA